jgi:modulator of FtsH protease
MAEAGASAALTGLIFVGVSLNLSKILSIRMLPDRALEALILLLSALTFSCLLLVPVHSHVVVGIEVLSLGLLLWLGVSACINAFQNGGFEIEKSRG